MWSSAPGQCSGGVEGGPLDPPEGQFGETPTKNETRTVGGDLQDLQFAMEVRPDPDAWSRSHSIPRRPLDSSNQV